MRIRTVSEELKKQYGQKIYRLSLSSGCTCPNRDGTCGVGGCTFCSEGGSGEFASASAPIEEQILEAKKKVDGKLPKNLSQSERKYIAYFQSFTNTYVRSNEELERLRRLYLETALRDDIVILSLGTRPDCLDERVLRMLQQIREVSKKPIWIELGLQTIHEESAQKFHRGYDLAVFEEAYCRLKEAGFTVIVHMILYLPDESEEDMLESMRYLANLKMPLDGIKLQLLNILKGTQMARTYEAEPFFLPDAETYCDTVVNCLKILPEEVVIHRMTGDGPKKLLLAPLWCGDKKRVHNMLQKKIADADR